MAPQRRPILDRFWEKVIVAGDDDCWLWTAATVEGYGIFFVEWGRSNTLAHRFAYEALVGPIPEGLTIDHLCRVTNCVNPRHLEPVTNVENVMRGEALSAQNARKTECLRGHPFDEENTYIKAIDGGRLQQRQCRECMRQRDRARQPRKK